jgi:diguanylate cyclase (GGDEF)-like protein
MIFLVVPILAAILIFTNDLTVRLILIALLIIYVAFIIFLRDSVRFSGGYSIPDSEDKNIDEFKSEQPAGFEESFKIVSKNKDVEVITDENYSPGIGVSKETLKPPDLKEKFVEIATEELPPSVGHDEQFAFVLEKILTIIQESYNASSSMFFWYNKKKEKLTLEKFVSHSRQISNRKYDLEDDILSKIVRNGEPELLSDISSAAEADVIRYYDSPQGIKSFVGVPVFYNENLIAILAIDAKANDVFGVETIYSLGRFVRIITMLIGLFEEKHSEAVSQQRLQALLKIIGPEVNFEDEQDIFLNLPGVLKSFFEWDAYTFVYYEPIEKKFETKKVVNETSLKYVGEGLKIDLNGTLVGKAISTGIPVKIDDTSLSEYHRFSKSEDVTFDGSFVALPLIYEKQNYGVICIESLKKNKYTNNDIQFLKKSFNFLAYVIHSHSTNKLLKNLISVDLETRTFNNETFKSLLHSDLMKAAQVSVPGTIVIIRVDDIFEQESLFEGDPIPKIVEVISQIINEEMNPFTLIGRLDEKQFAIYFFNQSSKNVFVWAEKLRVKIARTPVAIVTRQTTFTVSIGIASTTDKTDVNEVLHNAELALKKALEKGGNAVRNLN